MTDSNSKLRRILYWSLPIIIAAVAFSWWNVHRVPEILRGVTAAGGRWGACPLQEVEQQASKNNHLELPLAISSEFNKRLAERFPPETPEAKLVDALKLQGFVALANVCPTDPTTKDMQYRLNGNEVVADAYWKVDQHGNIVWTKGFVAYTFL